MLLELISVEKLTWMCRLDCMYGIRTKVVRKCNVKLKFYFSPITLEKWCQTKERIWKETWMNSNLSCCLTLDLKIYVGHFVSFENKIIKQLENIQSLIYSTRNAKIVTTFSVLPVKNLLALNGWVAFVESNKQLRTSRDGH